MDSITFFEVEEWEKEYLASKCTDKKVIFVKEKAQEVTDEELLSSVVLSSFIYSKLTKEILSKFPNLRCVATRSTGYDHIDLSYCKDHGITVVHVPSYGVHTVAEHTFALLLAISRKIVPTVEKSRHGHFNLDGLKGFDLYGKTIGIVGEGQIGSRVIDLSVSFGMNVLVFTRHPNENRDHVTYVSLEELLSRSDIVSLHVPFTPETHHIINKENIQLCKPGSILLNTSRGQLVETQAILEGLKTGKLQAAGLDVLEEEGSLKEERELVTEEFLKRGNLEIQLLNHVLLTRDDVIFTSHNAFNSKEALQEILDVTVQNINGFLSGTVLNGVSF